MWFSLTVYLLKWHGKGYFYQEKSPLPQVPLEACRGIDPHTNTELTTQTQSKICVQNAKHPPHDTPHLFNCRLNPTNLTPINLWTTPHQAANFLKLDEGITWRYFYPVRGSSWCDLQGHNIRSPLCYFNLILRNWMKYYLSM